MGRSRDTLNNPPNPAFGPSGSDETYEQGDNNVEQPPAPTPAPAISVLKILQRRTDGVQKGLRVNSITDALLRIASFVEGRPQKDIASEIITKALWDKYGSHIDNGE